VTSIEFDPKACETCRHFACVCDLRARHDEKCPFLLAAAGAVGLACQHGHDVCPICDPCTCPPRGGESS
jgi:hypothetical protein